MRMTIRTRVACAGAGCALLAATLLLLPRPIRAQQTEEEERALPVLFYSVAESDPDFDGDLGAALRAYRARVPQLGGNVRVSMFSEPLGTESGRIHWLEAVDDIPALRQIVSMSDVQIHEILASIKGAFRADTYHEAVLMPCPAKVAIPPDHADLFLVLRIARAKASEYSRALAAAIELADYMNEESAELWVQLYQNLFGEFGRLHLMIRVRDLAVWHSLEGTMLQDPRYVELFERTYAHCIEGSLETSWGYPLR